MRISPETKHVLIIGGALIAAVVLGIIVYKKFEANSQASQAANDQSEQDQLAYLESMGLEGGYGYGSTYDEFGDTTGTSAITLPTSPTSDSLAQEIQGIESAFGLGTTSSGSTTTGSSDAGSAAATTTHSLGSGSAPGQPRAAAVSAGTFQYGDTSGPISSGVYSLDDEPVGREGSYVA